MAEFIEVMQKKEEVCNHYRHCTGCPLSKDKLGCSSFMRCHPQEAEEIIMTWTHPVDWKNVDVDTPILVRQSVCDEWVKRHFAKLSNEGAVYAWIDGKTSYTVFKKQDMAAWRYAKLAEEVGVE